MGCIGYIYIYIKRYIRGPILRAHTQGPCSDPKTRGAFGLRGLGLNEVVG